MDNYGSILMAAKVPQLRLMVVLNNHLPATHKTPKNEDVHVEKSPLSSPSFLPHRHNKLISPPQKTKMPLCKMALMEQGKGSALVSFSIILS
jgi:hypothetical protein